MLLAATMLALGASHGSRVEGAKLYAWNECSMTPDDQWVPARADSLLAHMQQDYRRRYSCSSRKGERTNGAPAKIELFLTPRIDGVGHRGVNSITCASGAYSGAVTDLWGVGQRRS